ncbi:MAG TPA: periplasmic heavy metal sensor [Gemmatimonadales bacterium]|jgi:Spy/CpxP family protein refolding chaperone|nr:periplasmic heavy metal sensor [Gemmatimonadales bacterium]
MKRSILVAMLLAAAAFSPAARAQAPTPTPTPTPRPGEDPLAKLLFPPELVLQHAQELGLQPAQRTTIVNAVKEAQGDLFDFQLQMGDRSQELLKLIEPQQVDEAAVLAQVDRVLALEREMKRKQMQLLVRIKNALSKEQQARLRELQKMLGSPGRPEELLKMPALF